MYLPFLQHFLDTLTSGFKSIKQLSSQSADACSDAVVINDYDLIVLIDMTEISNYIRNQFTEVHICKQGGCNYLENNYLQGGCIII